MGIASRSASCQRKPFSGHKSKYHLFKSPAAARCFLLATTLAILLVVSGCQASGATGKPAGDTGYTADYAIAVIQTSRQKPSTFIEYYDKDLDLLTSIEYPYLTCQSPWGKPAVYDGVVYMTPQGKGLLANSSFVAALDMETGEVAELDADGGVTNVAVSDRYVFAAAQGGIGRIDPTTGEVLSIDQPGRLFPYSYGDKLYVFNDMRVILEEESGYLLIYDSDSMELLEEISLGEHSSIPQTIGFIGDRLYFVTVFDSEETPWDDIGWNLSYYSLEDGQIHILTTVTGMRIDHAAAIGSKIYLTGVGDETGDNRNKIFTIDQISGEIEGTLPVDYIPMYLYASEGVLYVAGDSTADMRGFLYSYAPDGTNLIETGKADLPLRNTTDVVYASTGLFAPR